MNYKTYETEIEKVETARIETDSLPILIKSTNDKKIKIIMTDFRQCDEISSELNEHELIFRQTVKGNIHKFWGMFHLRERLIVEVPAEYHGTLIIKTQNGSVKTEGLLNLNNLKCVTANGSIDVCGAKSETVLLQSSNGSIHFEQMKCDDIALITNNGSIKGLLMGDSSEYAIESQTTNGSNNLPNHKSASGLKHAASNKQGLFDKQPSLKNKKLVAKTTNGRILIDFMI